MKIQPKKLREVSLKLLKKLQSKFFIMDKNIEKNLLQNIIKLNNEKPIRRTQRKSLFAVRFVENVDNISSKHSIEFDPGKLKSIRDIIKAPIENIKNIYKNCSKIEVTLPFDVPQLHLIETKISSYPSAIQKQQIAALGVEVKKSIFSKTEDETIKNNFKSFCEMHKLEEDPTMFLNFKCFEKVLNKDNRIKFTRFLAHKLNNRLLHSVYGRFQRLIQNGKNKYGRFTEREDKIILEYMRCSDTPNPYVDLGKFLNRTKLSIYKRYVHLSSKDSNTNVRLRWNEEKIENLLKILAKVTNVSSLEELKTRKININEWKKVSCTISIPHVKLRRSWSNYLYQKLFAEDLDTTSKIRKKIINRLYDDGESDWRSINWIEIAKSFPGFTPERLSQCFKALVNYHVPENKRENLSECLHYLKHVFLVNHKLCGKAIRKIKVNEKIFVKNKGK